MIYTAARTDIFRNLQISAERILAGFIFIFLAACTLYAQTSIATEPDEKTLIIEDARDSDVFSFGKTVIVRQHAKGVLAFGGDVIVEGRVDGD